MFEPQLSKFKIKKFQKEIEPQEVFLDSLAQKKEEELGVSTPHQRAGGGYPKFETPLSKKILQGLYIALFILILALFAKTFQLQILEGKEYSLKSQEQRTRIYQIRPQRGVIYDKNLKQLVFNKPSFDLVCDKRDLPWNEDEKLKILGKVSEIIKEDVKDLQEKIDANQFFRVLISENIPHQTLIILEPRIDQLPGFQIEKNTVRDYIEGFSHLIGHTGKINPDELTSFQNYSITDYIGKTGLEKAYEEILRGKPGQLRIEKDAFGKNLKEEIDFQPKAGKSLVLWVDSDLQKKIIESLEKALKNVGAKKAAAVALNPKTGGVLALVSFPGFNNNKFSQGISQTELNEIQNDPSDPLFNRAISGIGYPTGSTIKPLIASAALEEDLISPQKHINCQGVIEVEHEHNPEITYKYHDWQVHGLTDIRKAIAESCNIYFYTIGGGYKDFKGLGPQIIKKYLRLFGWGQKTGIDLPGEGEGILPKIDENWRLGNTYHLSIGQGPFSITPLQVAAAFSAIANGGKVFKPRVVQKIVTNPKNVVEEIQSEVFRQDFIDPKNLRIVKEGMRQAVTSGSSVLLNSLPVKVAAKTGTAQASREGYFHNWVTVFAPYDDPQIVLTIIIENVKGAQVVALPVAKEVLEWYFTKE